MRDWQREQAEWLREVGAARALRDRPRKIPRAWRVSIAGFVGSRMMATSASEYLDQEGVLLTGGPEWIAGARSDEGVFGGSALCLLVDGRMVRLTYEGVWGPREASYTARVDDVRLTGSGGSRGSAALRA